MKTIIAGKRDYEDKDFVFKHIEKYMKENLISEIIEGGAWGVDYFAGIFAVLNKITHKTVHADWPNYGKQAGPIRNQIMVDQADALLAFHDGKSRGTKDVIEKAKKAGLKVTIIDI